jgi:hypothetical protein
MKKLYSLITIAILVSVFHQQTMGQPVSAPTYIGDYSKMTSGDDDLANSSWTYRLKSLKNNKYTLSVTLKDKSVKEVNSKIYAENNRGYLVFDNGDQPQKIYCDETIAISRITDRGAVKGIVTDSCWLFKIVEGKINAYSFLAQADGPYSIIAIQMGAGPVQNFDIQLLGDLLKKDTKAYKAYLKKDYLKAIEKYNEDNE